MAQDCELGAMLRELDYKWPPPSSIALAWKFYVRAPSGGEPLFCSRRDGAAQNACGYWMVWSFIKCPASAANPRPRWRAVQAYYAPWPGHLLSWRVKPLRYKPKLSVVADGMAFCDGSAVLNGHEDYI